MNDKVIERNDLPKCPICGSIGISFINVCYVRCSNEKCLLSENDYSARKWKENCDAKVQG
jgi:hypothetical protein